MSFFGVPKEFSDINTPKTQKIIRAFILFVEGIRRSAERIKIKLFEPNFIFIRDFQKLGSALPRTRK